MQKRRGWAFGGILLVAGGASLLAHPEETIVGAFIGSNISSVTSSLIGFLCMLIGGVMIFADKSIDTLVDELHRKIDALREKRKGNPKYREGLDEIEKTIEQDKKEYQQAEKSNWLKGNIMRRLKRWEESLERRDEQFFRVPHEVKGVRDLPDRGLYEYKPLQGKKTKMMELEVTHYTDRQSYQQIRKCLEQGKQEILWRDGAGWAYFVAKPVQERLETKELRTILGTGLQDYAPFPKHKVRNPEAMITMKIRVPRERVLERNETYKLKAGGTITVKKYAVAGGISAEDIVRDVGVQGKRYLNRGLDEQRTKKEGWLVLK